MLEIVGVGAHILYNFSMLEVHNTQEITQIPDIVCRCGQPSPHMRAVVAMKPSKAGLVLVEICSQM